MLFLPDFVKLDEVGVARAGRRLSLQMPVLALPAATRPFYVAFGAKSNSHHRTGFGRSEWWEPALVRRVKPLKTIRIGQ
jgi:hypothetical protein